MVTKSSGSRELAELTDSKKVPLKKISPCVSVAKQNECSEVDFTCQGIGVGFSGFSCDFLRYGPKKLG